MRVGERPKEVRVSELRGALHGELHPSVPAPGIEPTIGVLALQGDFAAHATALARAGAGRIHEVRKRGELSACDGLVLPGGESTTLIKLLKEEALWDPLRRFADEGRALFGTCAGLILMAEKVSAPEQDSLALLPVQVRRNGYGRQVDSHVVPGRVRIPDDFSPEERRGLRWSPATEREADAASVPAPQIFENEAGAFFDTEFVFIRAPKILSCGAGVETLAHQGNDPVLVRSGLRMAAAFHPEMARDDGVARLFLALARRARARRE